MNKIKKSKQVIHKKLGINDFFILILVYSYYNKKSNTKNEFSIPQSVLARYFDCSKRTIIRWFKKLHELKCIQYAKRDNAGKIQFYIIDNQKHSYVIPQYKKIRCGKPDECKFLNVYQLNQQKLNQYLIDTIQTNVLDNIEAYYELFSLFISFLTNSKAETNIVEKKHKNIDSKIQENQYFINKKKELDKFFPEFQCKYLEEGCLRLTHEICSTVNPEHVEKINETNYWRSSTIRQNMLTKLLDSDKLAEYDINGSIYRLTYNLTHDTLLSNTVDIYKLIWNECKFSITLDKEILRTSFKKILMPIYMKEHTLMYRACHWEYLDKYFAGHPIKYNKLHNDIKEFYELYKQFVDITGLSIKQFLVTVADAMHKVLNIEKFYGSDIFIYESNLHILIREYFMKQNIKCVNVYDGFYFVKSQVSKQDFYNAYTQSMLQLKPMTI